jgi:hypothetical protein
MEVVAMTGKALLPDALAAIKLIVDSIRTQFTPDKKRERFAKDLLKLYLDVGEIVARGRELLSYVNPNQPIAENIPIEVLRSQQAGLISFHKHLDSVAAILELHLPSRAQRLEVLSAFKTAAVAFLLTFLIEMPPITLDDAAWKTPEVQALVEKCKLLGLEWEVCGVIPLPDKPWISEDHQDWDVCAVLIATPPDIDVVGRMLDEMATIQEQLRLFLIEKFKIEDLL